MKKTCTKIIIAFLLLLIPLTIKAEDNKITKEALSNAYRDILACNKEGNYTEHSYEQVDEDGAKTTITYKECKEDMDYSGINMDEYITDDKIYIDASDGSKKEINYTIQDNNDVLFSISRTIDNTTTYDQYQEYTSEGIGLIIGYPIVAATKGIKYNDSSAYISSYFMEFISKALESLMSNSSPSNSNYLIVDDDATVDADPGVTVIKKSEFPAHAVEYATNTNGTEKITYSDEDEIDTFELTTTPDVSDSTKYVLNYELLVKGSNDFSAIEGMSNSFINGEGTKDSLDPTEETEEEVEEEKDYSTVENPKTGYIISIVSTLVLLTIAVIIVIRNKSSFKKI